MDQSAWPRRHFFVEGLAGLGQGLKREEEPMPEYVGKAATIRYDDKVCTHAGECVRGLPAVFNANQDPWIQPDGGTLSALEAAVARCPSGALTLHRTG